MEESRLSTSWSTPEVGYFIPKISTRYHEPKHMEIDRDHVTLFYNVHAFVAHLRGLLNFKQEPVIRANVYSCLREDALDWFNTELTDSERSQLTVLPLEQGWFNMLLKRFTPPIEVMLFRMDHVEFDSTNPNDYGERDTSLCQLARDTVRYTQALGIESQEEKVKAVWNRLREMEGFSGLVAKPRSDTSMSEFLRKIDLADQLRMYQFNSDAQWYWNSWWEKEGKKLTRRGDMREEPEKPKAEPEA